LLPLSPFYKSGSHRKKARTIRIENCKWRGRREIGRRSIGEKTTGEGTSRHVQDKEKNKEEAVLGRRKSKHVPISKEREEKGFLGSSCASASLA